MITINVPKCVEDKAEELKRRGLRVEVISDEEYIKRFGRNSLEEAKTINI